MFPHFILRLLVAVALLVPAGAMAQSQKAFRHDDLGNDALRLESLLVQHARGNKRPVADIIKDADLAEAKSDLKASVRLLSLAAGSEPRNPALLLRLSRAYSRMDGRNAGDQLLEFQTRMSAAAFLAYQRAATPQAEAEALAFLGNTLVRRQLWRPAIDSLKIAQQLAPNPVVKAQYEDLVSKHGFRLMDYTVDSDAASPRVCFQFSEDLKVRLDAAPFVAMPEGVPGGISASGQQLCVDGLRHGQRYQITLRSGLPSQLGESLRQPASFDIYVRDRTPSVRFTGRNYILPRSSQQGIPVVTINLSDVKLGIYRFSERSLTHAMLGNGFMGSLNGEDARKIAEKTGAHVWTGFLASEARLNEEVVTAFPVAEAVGALAPGIYVLIAQRGDLADGADSWEALATQWLMVSDIGLSSVWANNGLMIDTRRLSDGAAAGGVELTLLALNNEVLATGTSDASGRFVFAAGMVHGTGGMAPGIITARTKDGDFAALSLEASPFDLTDRGVTGRPAPAALDAFLYTERGVYRPGESVALTALLRDGDGNAVKGLPAVLVVQRPDGVEYKRVTLEDQGLGGRSLRIALLDSAATGKWTAKLFADPAQPAIGETRFLVEDYAPDRIAFEATSPMSAALPLAPVRVRIEGTYLFGAPASGLELDGEVVVQPASAPPQGLEGYRVGVEDEEFSPVRRPIPALPRTDANGKALLDIDLPALPATSRPLSARIIMRMLEAGGRGVERRIDLPIAEARPFIGVRPQFGTMIGEGETAVFDIATLGSDGKPAATSGLKWEMVRIDRKFQWYRADGRWNYEPVTSTQRVANGTTQTAIGTPARISAKVGWGQYRLDVTSPDGTAQTSVSFTAGYSGAVAADAPDVLEVALDKPRVHAGDKARIRFNARFAGKARIDVAAEKLLHSVEATISEGSNSIELDTGKDWGAGAYVVVTAFRPMNIEQKRMPGRAMGLVWLGMDPAPRMLGISLGAPASMTPRGKLVVPVQLTGMEGSEAFVTLSAVDVGILNLTSFAPPAPEEWYFGQRALGAEFRDIYGHLIDGLAGIRGRIRSGGDGTGGGLEGSPPTQAPLALFSGIVKVGPDGKAEIAFDIPDFAGSMRLSAVAWSAGKVGHASTDVVVRDPVVVLASAPRFLAIGDQARLRLDVHNVDGQDGEYALTLAPQGGLAVANAHQPRKLKLAKGEKAALWLDATATAAGDGLIAVHVAGPAGVSTGHDLHLRIQPAYPVTLAREVRPLEPSGRIEIPADALSRFVAGTGIASVTVSPFAAFDVAGLVTALDRYPYGCTEQTISRALPLLYLDKLVPEASLALPEPAKASAQAAVDRILSRQAGNGVFGLWGAGDGELWLNAYAADFLTRAREKGLVVPKEALDSSLTYLRNIITNMAEPDAEDAKGYAYALYVLARNGRPVIGDLRYVADTKLKNMGSALAQGQIGAALGLMGDLRRANSAVRTAAATLAAPADEAQSRGDFGSSLRDGAGLLALIAESNLDHTPVPAIAAAMETRRMAAKSGTSTQENAWIALAAQAIGKESAAMALGINGQPHTGALNRNVRGSDLSSGPLTISNEGTARLYASITLSGSPLVPEPAAANEFKLERSYYRLDGTPLPAGPVARNERLIVVLRVTEAIPREGRLALVDPLPAGFEIENPALLEGGKLTALRLPASEVQPVSTQFRDDRFFAAFERKENEAQSFSVAYIVRAITPGSFAHPGARIEDMYRPDRFARLAASRLSVSGGQ